MRIAHEESPAIRSAEEELLKAKAGFGAAKDAYIPDITGLARYSYQSGVPLLVHNFGTFGFNLSYDLFDGGSRHAELKGARTVLSQAQINLDKVDEGSDSRSGNRLTTRWNNFRAWFMLRKRLRLFGQRLPAWPIVSLNRMPPWRRLDLRLMRRPHRHGHRFWKHNSACR